jgi:HD-GYP domain-containing protein (c-di-GMP phosphodiesterase class II)
MAEPSGRRADFLMALAYATDLAAGHSRDLALRSCVLAMRLAEVERLDGSGYHRDSRGSDLSPAARVLAAAEAFQTAREARPHRPAMSDAAAAAKLRSAVREGRLCPDAVEAVLTCAGNPRAEARPSGWPG